MGLCVIRPQQMDTHTLCRSSLRGIRVLSLSVIPLSRVPHIFFSHSALSCPWGAFVHFNIEQWACILTSLSGILLRNWCLMMSVQSDPKLLFLEYAKSAFPNKLRAMLLANAFLWRIWFYLAGPLNPSYILARLQTAPWASGWHEGDMLKHIWASCSVTRTHEASNMSVTKYPVKCLHPTQHVLEEDAFHFIGWILEIWETNLLSPHKSQCVCVRSEEIRATHTLRHTHTEGCLVLLSIRFVF